MGCPNSRRSERLARAIAIALGLSVAGRAPAQSVAFDIPEEDALSAIPEFARQANLQIVAPANELKGIRTHAVRGTIDVHAALEQLLRGTGIVVASDDGHLISLHLAAGPPSTSDRAGESEITSELGEVVVTATRRAERLQDVPITIQALTGETIFQLNVKTFDDYVKYLPNVTSAGNGPAQSNIYMRGLATNAGSLQGSGGAASFPNVAIYLDEQSGQVPGRNLDVYAADLDRIEVLEGPQGTLFGAGAQAGVVRYITNKPKLDVTEANMSAGYAVTAHGDPSSSVEAMLNLPLLTDRLALRGVIYDETRGGYINNIPGTFNREPTDKVVVNYFGGVVPPNSGPLSNSADVGNAINPVTYKGLRVEALYQFNDDWNLLLSQSYQNIDAEGVFWEEQYDGAYNKLPPLSVQLYNPSFDKDKFEDTQVTLTGRLGALKLVYSGGYLDRRSDQVQDYTNYSRGFYAGYYQCSDPGYPFKNGNPTAGSAGYCYSPSSFWTDHELTTHQSHELRLSTPDDWRLRGLAGLFWEDYTIHEQTDWFYGTDPNFEPIGPPTLPVPVTSNNPSVRPLGDVFFDDITRGYKQKAAFGSVDFEVIPKRLVITAGTRYYDIQNFESGSDVGSFGCEIYGPGGQNIPPNPCINVSNVTNLNALGLHKSDVGFKSRANISWHLTDDLLLYYTWSQGFRAGGFNRGLSIITPTSPIYGLFAPPIAYGPDVLVNNELGWKTEWLDHRIQWNGALYQEDWKNTQIAIFDPGVTGDLTFTTNGPNYRVRGLETSFVTRLTPGLTVTGAAAWNSSEVVKTLSLVDPKTGQLIDIANPFGALGSPLAQSPPFQGNIRARYEFAFQSYCAFVQAGATHQAHSYASTNQLTTELNGSTHTAYEDPPFSTYDAAAGISKDAWSVQGYVENLTDARANLYSFYNEYVKSTTVNRPRTLGVRFSYRFSEPK
jgi:iron complex outermembrane recepter protein